MAVTYHGSSDRIAYGQPPVSVFHYDAATTVKAIEFLNRDWQEIQGYYNPWQRATLLFSPTAGKRVASAAIKVMAGDLEPNVYITDIQMQGGNILTGWNPSKTDSLSYLGFKMWMFVVERDYIEQSGKVIGP